MPKNPSRKKFTVKQTRHSQWQFRRTVPLLAIIIFAFVGSYFIFFSKAATVTLTWAPPTGYQNYPVKNVSVSNSTQTISGGGGDMWVKLPGSPTGPINLTNCRNVVIIGGQINIPAGTGPASPDIRGIYINGCTGTVHIEGVYINGDIATAEGDGIAIQAPNAIVQVQNVRIYKLYGAYDTASHNHSDIIQPWGGVKELRVDRLTGSSSYQGFQINDDTGHIGKVIIKNVNIGDSGVTPPDGKGGYYAWLKCGTGTTYSFSNFYIQPRSGRSLSNSIYDSSAACGMSASSITASFSSSAVTGTILAGKPSTGDFVPAGSVGIGYTAAGVTPTPTTPPPTTPTTPTAPTAPTVPTTPTTPTAPTTPIVVNPGEGNSGGNVGGTVTVQVPTTGSAPAKTEVYVDGVLKKVVANGDTAAFDTAGLDNGTHDVTVRTTDVNGAVAESKTQIEVSNPLWRQVASQLFSPTGRIALGAFVVSAFGIGFYLYVLPRIRNRSPY